MTAMGERHPHLRLLFAPWRLSLCTAGYYGWRYWLHVGPVVILIGKAKA